MPFGWHGDFSECGGYGMRIASPVFTPKQRCAAFSVLRQREFLMYSRITVSSRPTVVPSGPEARPHEITLLLPADTGQMDAVSVPRNSSPSTIFCGTWKAL